METTAQHQLTDAQVVSEQWPLSQLPPSFTAEHDPYGLEYPLAQLGSAVPIVLLSISSCTPSLLAGWTVWKGLDSMYSSAIAKITLY